jgi:anti-sigma regulatory factor (Ser/Thr protein kinase)
MLTTTAPPYSRVFHGAPDRIGRVRSEVREYLDRCPVADDVVLIVSELATNAIRHSDSKGAFFIVRCKLFRDYVWVACEDLGGPLRPRPEDGRPHGLDIVEALAGPDGWGAERETGLSS